MTNQKIPFLDLVTPHVELKNELMQVVSSAIDTAGYISAVLKSM